LYEKYKIVTPQDARDKLRKTAAMAGLQYPEFEKVGESKSLKDVFSK
jgi:hypothetical protein